jgi:Tol biopolymer transport system component
MMAGRNPQWFAQAVGVLVVAAWTWAGCRSSHAPDASDAARSLNDTPDSAANARLDPHQVTVGAGYDGFLAFAPDGQSVAFSSDRSGALEIYVQGIAPGSTATALTGNGRHNIRPAWSPDGQFIAYHEMSANGVWVVPSGGGAAKRVSGFGSSPSWSPDGKLVAFQSPPTDEINPTGIPRMRSTIWVVDSQGRSEPRAVTTAGEPAGHHLAPVWWQGSTRLLFAVQPEGASSGKVTSLWSVEADGRHLTRIRSHQALGPEYVLAPDGRSAYFPSQGAIWWLPLDDRMKSAGEPRPTGIPAIGSTIAQLAISPDGRRIAWTALDSSRHVWASYLRGGGHVVAPLTEGVGIRYGRPQPASDSRIALVGTPAGSHSKILLLSADSSLRALTSDPANHGDPQWLPGEREIAFVTNHGPGPGYWAVDPETGRERPLFLLSDLAHPPGQSRAPTATPAAGIAFTRDFTRLALAVVRDGAPNLWVTPLRELRPGGSLVQRTFEREGGRDPAWSPDGNWIAYQCAAGPDTHVCVVHAETGERRQLTTDADGQSRVGGWASDNDRILFASRRQAVWNVASISRATSEVRDLTHFTTPRLSVQYPQWDDANDRVVFERSETTGRIWSVELPERTMAGTRKAIADATRTEAKHDQVPGRYDSAVGSEPDVSGSAGGSAFGGSSRWMRTQFLPSRFAR